MAIHETLTSSIKDSDLPRYRVIGGEATDGAQSGGAESKEEKGEG